MKSIYQRIKDNETKPAVIGLGYVGLPLALELGKTCTTYGFDINHERIELMKKHIDPSKELAESDFENTNIHFTADAGDLAEAGFYIVAVPTPIDEYRQPDLKPLMSACKTVGKVLSKGDYVVFESTVYPGCTEEDCVPVLEQYSDLKFNEDFKVGFSPERINPGDKVNTLKTITKVVSGSDDEALENIAAVYELIVEAGVHRAASIKVAEAAKIIENTQRDVNIAFMNELSIIFNRIGINTYEVLEAAGTKWNFLKFFPGLVGGHCIGVDPYYLVHKAKELGYHPQIINAGRFLNDSMGGYIGKQVVKKIAAQNKNISDSKVLIMGITFKENVSDIRNTKVSDLIKELESYNVKVDTIDPGANPQEVYEEYGIRLCEKTADDYDAVVVAVNHKEYADLSEDYFLSITSENAVLVDIKGIYRDKIHKMLYWSL